MTTELNNTIPIKIRTHVPLKPIHIASVEEPRHCVGKVYQGITFIERRKNQQPEFWSRFRLYIVITIFLALISCNDHCTFSFRVVFPATRGFCNSLISDFAFHCVQIMD